MFIETLVDKELAPGHRAVGVQSFVTGHLQLGTEIKRGVRVYQQQRMMV